VGRGLPKSEPVRPQRRRGLTLTPFFCQSELETAKDKRV